MASVGSRFFGYLLSTLPLLKSGLALGTALSVGLAAGNLSIATMELVDNLVMALIPGVMDTGLVNVIFLGGDDDRSHGRVFRGLAGQPLPAAAGQGPRADARVPRCGGAIGVRRFILSVGTGALVATILAFMIGGLVVSIAADIEADDSSGGSHAAQLGA